MEFNRNHNKQKWQNIITEAKASGMSAPAFCKARGIKYPTYSYWVRKLGLAAGRLPMVKVVGPQSARVGVNAGFVKIEAGIAIVSVSVSAGAQWAAEFVKCMNAQMGFQG
jgi:hypothetical protein